MFWTEKEIERQQHLSHIGKLTADAAAARYRADQLDGAADRAAQFGHKDRAQEYREIAQASRDEHKRLTDEAAKEAKKHASD
jgi:hypothetical protein